MARTARTNLPGEQIALCDQLGMNHWQKRSENEQHMAGFARHEPEDPGRKIESVPASAISLQSHFWAATVINSGFAPHGVCDQDPRRQLSLHQRAHVPVSQASTLCIQYQSQ